MKGKKFSMEESSSISFWKVAVTILLAAILIGIVLLISRQGKSVTNEKLEGISNAIADYQDENYSMYENMEVSGAEVMDLVERANMRGDVLCIRVFTKVSANGTDYIKKAAGAVTEKEFVAITNEDGLRAAVVEKGSTQYINPSAIFTGDVCRNENGVLVGVVFEQK